MAHKPISTLAITPGEPAGIGLDVTIANAQHAADYQRVVICDPIALETRARQLKLPLSLKPFNREAAASRAGELSIVPIDFPHTVEPGKPNPANAAAILKALDAAIDGCLDHRFDAVVTGPLNKNVINTGMKMLDANAALFTGHTEYFARRCKVERVVMMLATQASGSLKQPLRVALATTHLPLKQVSEAINDTLLTQIITILHGDLRDYFGLDNPRIVVCGLNPHAGEGGDLGREEIEIINPCLTRLRNQGINVSEALPADTVFTPHHLEQADAVLAMYHDQGLPVLKSHGFGKAANITLGLPIIRSSVDHGTAFDLAGTGRADQGSMATALDIAAQLAKTRQINKPQ